jgi:hypothetical protein
MTPSGIDPATFRQKQDCTYINNGTVSYKVSFKKCSPGRNASEPIKNSIFNKGILTRVSGMNLITPTFFCVLVCINFWKLIWPWDLCRTRPFDQSQHESSPVVLLQRAQRWCAWSAATRYRLRVPAACLNGPEHLASPRFETRTVQTISSRFTDYVIPAATHWQ